MLLDLLVVVVIILLKEIPANDKLQIAYKWKMIRIAFPQAKTALDTKQYIPENHLPFALDVYEDRLFIAIPRLKEKIVASLAYIRLSDANNDHPRFYPYPSMHFHDLKSKSTTTIGSAISIRVDRCRRLWVLDQGIINAGTDFLTLSNPQIFIFNLENDRLLSIYTLPDDQCSGNSYFANMVVEDNDCDNTFAYLADMDHPSMVVYSHKTNSSWLVRHRYFEKRPEPGFIGFKGDNYDNLQFGLFGMALSRPDPGGFSTMYFHPIWGDEEYTVSTRILRNEILVNDKLTTLNEFKRLGSRGPRGESGAMFLDQNFDVLFFASLHRNEVNCWRTTKTYSDKHHGTVLSNSSLEFPNDIKIDSNGTIWVLSNNFPVFLSSNSIDAGLHNYVVFTGNVIDVIKDTPCDSEMAMRIRRKLDVPSQNRLEGRINSSAQHLCLHILVTLIFISAYVLR